MEQDPRNHGYNSQRNQPRTEKEEEYILPRAGITGNSGTKEVKHQCRFKKNQPNNIINLSSHTLTPGETSLLTKGLNFIPTPYQEHLARIIQDILLFDGRIH